MARCPDCNKFTQSKSAEPELESGEFDERTGAIQISITIARDCEDCGATLKSGLIELEGEVPSEIMEKYKEEDGWNLEMEVSDIESIEDMETKIAKKGRFKGQSVPVAFLFGASAIANIYATKELDIAKELAHEICLKDTMRSQDMNDEV